MKIIYIHQYFKPSEGVRSFEFIKHFLEKGHQVRVITAEKIDPDFKMDGLEIVSTNTKYNNNMSKMQRIFAFVKFMFKGLFKGLGVKKPDVVFATSTPLTVGFPAVIIKKFKRCRMVFEVRDVWPDIPIEMGFIKGRFMKWALKKYEKWVYKNSAHIVPLSKGMYENIRAKGVPEEKLTTIENIANLYFNDKDFKSAISEYDDGINAIKELTEGTTEYVDAIEEANAKTLKLIETYGMFNDWSRGKDGLIELDPDAIIKMRE